MEKERTVPKTKNIMAVRREGFESNIPRAITKTIVAGRNGACRISKDATYATRQTGTARGRNVAHNPPAKTDCLMSGEVSDFVLVRKAFNKMSADNNTINPARILGNAADPIGSNRGGGRPMEP